MDDVVNRFARELADAIAAAVAENSQVEACREKARAAGFEMKVTLEAVVGFVSRSQTAALTKVAAPARVVQPRRTFEVTANDRRFLRSLRIAADETADLRLPGIDRAITVYRQHPGAARTTDAPRSALGQGLAYSSPRNESRCHRA